MFHLIAQTSSRHLNKFDVSLSPYSSIILTGQEKLNMKEICDPFQNETVVIIFFG